MSFGGGRESDLGAPAGRGLITGFEVTDFGYTVRLGQFETAADAILYEFDPEARRCAKQRGIAKDASFGGAPICSR